MNRIPRLDHRGKGLQQMGTRADPAYPSSNYPRLTPTSPSPQHHGILESQRVKEGGPRCGPAHPCSLGPGVLLLVLAGGLVNGWFSSLLKTSLRCLEHETCFSPGHEQRAGLDSVSVPIRVGVLSGDEDGLGHTGKQSISQRRTVKPFTYRTAHCCVPLAHSPSPPPFKFSSMIRI